MNAVGKADIVCGYLKHPYANGRTVKATFEVQLVDRQDNSGTDPEPKPEVEKSQN